MEIDVKKIKIIMARRKMSNKALAERMGISQQNIGVWFRKKTVLPETAGKIAAALEVDVTEILADSNF